jgi:hypothetical protein
MKKITLEKSAKKLSNDENVQTKKVDGKILSRQDYDHGRRTGVQPSMEGHRTRAF